MDDFLGSLADVGMVVGPNIGYFLQYLKMHGSGDSEGFSALVSFILLSSNLIRVFWWIEAQFSSVILIASLVMLVC